MSFVTWNHGQGTPYRFPVYSILVATGDRNILIDTGFTKEWVDEVLPFENPEQTKEQTLAGQLATIGLATGDIDTVVNSHLHFDHCCGNKFFPDAKFIVTREEMRHAYVPDPWERLGYDRRLVDIPGADYELLDLNGYDYQVAPGITLIESPGHSCGHLSAVVEPSEETPMVFPIDVAWTKHNLEDRVMMGLHSDPRELLESMIKIQNVAEKVGGSIFYSHDADEYKTYKTAPEFYGE